MKEKDARLTRLAAILTQLQSKRLITATELANKHQVSVRTIYRDIRSLEASGIPIAVEEGKGYTLVEGYRLPPVMFTEEEANALITAEQLVAQNSDTSFLNNYADAIIKIKAVLNYDAKNKASLLSERTHIRKSVTQENSSNNLSKVQSAITNFTLVKIKYSNLNQEISDRLIEPFAIYSTQGNWIMIAFCRLRNSFRAFRLDRIHQFFATSDHFEPHQITLEQYFESVRKMYE